MKSKITFVCAAALVASMAVPALAQMDAATTTCGAFFALDAGGRVEATNAVVNFVKDTANAAVAGPAASVLQDATHEQALQMIEAACEGQTVDTNLLSVLK